MLCEVQSFHDALTVSRILLKALSIFVNLGDNVDINTFSDVTNISFAKIENIEDLKKYRFVIDAFPDITEDMDFKEKGLELFMKITNDINKKNEDDAKMNEDVFKPKKPVVTYGLIFINVLIFLLCLSLFLFLLLLLYFQMNLYWAALCLHYTILLQILQQLKLLKKLSLILYNLFSS